LITGILVTETVTDFVVVPSLFVAVILYVVVELGDTSCVPDEDTSPTPWFIETVVAPDVAHASVAELPEAIDEGETVKVLTTGNVEAGTSVSGGVLLSLPGMKKVPFEAMLIPAIASKTTIITDMAMIKVEGPFF
jgi:hypothetical protein